jgi:hypothetical protein
MLRLDRAIRKRDANEEEMDTIRCYIEAFLQKHDNVAPADGRIAGQEILADSRRRKQLEAARVEYAANGAKDLKVVPLPSGAFDVLIDGQHHLKLAPQLGVLLQILVESDGASVDALVPWKSRSRVRAALSAVSGRMISDHGLTQLVSRLRKELFLQANLHRDFVAVHPSLGMRFALQQKTGEPAAFVNR